MAEKRKDLKGRALWRGECQRSDGQYSYRYTDPTGKRHAVYSWRLVATDVVPEGKKPCKPLRDLEKEIRRDMEDGIRFTTPEMTTLNDFWDKYISMKYELKESTLVSYIYTYNRYIRGDFGKRPVTSIKYSDLKKFYLSLVQGGLHPNTLDNVHSVIHPVLTMAVRDGYIRNNPADGVVAEIKKTHHKDPEKRHALTIPQQNAFVEYVSTSLAYKHWLPIVTILLGTGMRIGEMIGLRWDDIDFEKNLISINHSLLYRTTVDGVSKYSISTPKTKSGVRSIPMMQDVRDTFQRMYDRRYDFHPNLALVIDGYTNFIFRNLQGSIQSPATINEAFGKIVAEYNEAEKKQALQEEREPVLLPHISCHILRHTFATRLVECECNIKTVQDVMGHSDIQTTLSIYADCTLEKKQESFNGLEGKFRIK